ncbi:MAG: type IV toxin-antitoxin system AbiEi family antitoxin domain-containing protein [Synergistales bacterium]|nr:type IV toxin-antitoxin system AbiEi family antitoxin domain-containing protein [Synergistales bacterium]
MRYEAFFRSHPVFRKKELMDYLEIDTESGSRRVEALLGYHRRTGRLLQVRRGLYAVVPRGVSPEHYLVDPFQIAAKAEEDAVLSHHTALELHGWAYSVWHCFLFSAKEPSRAFEFRNNRFRGVRFPAVLRRKDSEQAEVETNYHRDLDIPVTSLERTIVDCFTRPDLAGGWEELWRSLDFVDYFKLDRIVAYVALLENATTAAKVGFYLERNRERLMVGEAYLRELEKMRPKSVHYLDRSRRRSGRYVPRWNLMVPEEVATQLWEQIL